MRPIAVEDIDQYLSDGRYLPTHVVYIFAIEVCANRAIRLDLALQPPRPAWIVLVHSQKNGASSKGYHVSTRFSIFQKR